MSVEEEVNQAMYSAMIHGVMPMPQEQLNEGFTAYTAGKEFHESPYPMFTVKGLAWRFGWNEAALAARN